MWNVLIAVSECSVHLLYLYVYLCAGEEVKEQLRREIVETKRAIGEEVREKDLIGKTADELRNKVKKLEGEKNEMSRVIQEARQRIGGNWIYLFVLNVLRAED